MNYHVSAKYNYNHQLFAGINFSADGSSSVGTEASPIQIYPAVNVAWSVSNSY